MPDSPLYKQTPLLDRVSSPADLRNLSLGQLQQLVEELRAETIRTVALTGGHLGAGLGVIELTVALHSVFETPEDRLIWDVGHQSYPHKILTGRRERIRTLRQGGGLSGFTKRSESPYDPFGAGHSSTSLSAGLGMAVGRDLRGDKRHVIAVIGDGSMSAGMAFEAMNNAGASNSRLIVILNDNEMSIAPPVGALSAHLSRLLTSKPYLGIRHAIKDLAHMFPAPLERAARKAEEYARNVVAGESTLFEKLGFYYAGPIDGHNLTHLMPILRNIRDSDETTPVLIHVVTRKGHGYAPAEQAPDKYHGVSCFDVKTGTQVKPPQGALSYTQAFSQTLLTEAEADERIVAITAAMPDGTGLAAFQKRFPKRFFDVGIAEQHAVAFAAGLACEGIKPFCAIYSSFMQRAYDQVVHDVVLQRLPVRLILDRAGLVGADGATHAGAFDLAYLGCLPDIVLMAPSDEAELAHMVSTAAELDDRPSAIRFPRGEGTGVGLPSKRAVLPIGKGRMVRQGTKVALLSLGTRLHDCLKAAETLETHGLSTSVADARFAKPLDTELIARLAREHEVLITVEEGSAGGFSAHVMHFLAHAGLLDRGLKFRPLTLPDVFIDHDAMTVQYDRAGLNAPQIATAALNALGISRDLRLEVVSAAVS